MKNHGRLPIADCRFGGVRLVSNRQSTFDSRKCIWALLCTLACVLVSSSARAQVVKLNVDDTIHPITAEYIGRGIQYATQIHAEAVLIQLQTPGGLETSTRDIIQEIIASPVPVIIYVSPAGARAASAGFFILESADIAAMAPGTNTGAAHPVGPTGGDIPGNMGQKVENDAAALMRSVASKRGRNVEIAESAVRQSKSFTDDEALKDHLIDVIAKDQDDLLHQLDGRTINRFHGEKVTLHTANQRIVDYDETLKQKILSFLMDPNMAFVLLVIGALGLYFEFTHPGVVVPGIIGFFFIVLAVFALNILPVNWAAVAMILLAFVFFALEAKFASHGALAIAGIASLTIGGLLLVDGPIPQMRVHLLTALAVSIPFGLITTFLMAIALKARRNKMAVGPQALIGEVAVVRTPLAPEGKVFVHGELWNAISSTPADIGEEVKVLGVTDLTLKVERVGSRQSPVASPVDSATR